MTASHTAVAANRRAGVNFRRLLIWAVLIVVIAAAADLLGWNIRGWFSNLWDTISEISAPTSSPAVALKTVQTSADRVRLVLDPALRVPDHELQGRARLLRDLGGAERLPAGEHRHLRDAADVHHDHRRRDLLRRARRLRGREDLLHRDRRLHVPLPLPLGRRLVRHQVRLRARAPVGDRDPAARRGLPDLPAHPRLLAEGRPAGGTTRRRAAASSASRGSTSSASSRRRCSAGSRASA